MSDSDSEDSSEEEESSEEIEQSSSHDTDSQKIAFKRPDTPEGENGGRMIGRTKLMIELDKLGDPDHENSEDLLENSFDDGTDDEDEEPEEEEEEEMSDEEEKQVELKEPL